MFSIIFTVLGYTGSVVIALIQIPQIYHTFTRKKTADLSLYSITLNKFASACMFAYSAYYNLYPISIASGCSILTNTTLIILYKKYNTQLPHIEDWELESQRPECLSPKNKIDINLDT